MTLPELKDSAEKAWWRSLESRRLGTPFFPWKIPLPRISTRENDYVLIAHQSEALLAGAKAKTGRGYIVITETRNLRRWGRNVVPVRVVFETADDLDAFVGRQRQAAEFDRHCAEIAGRFPSLNQWAARHARHVLEHGANWTDLLTVCEYFVATPKPGVYLREIPLPVHTKFIEENRGILRLLLDQLLPSAELGGGGFEARFGLRVPASLVRVRFLDDRLRCRFGFPFAQVGIERADFAQLALDGVNLLITENEVTFLTLPLLPNTVGIWGSGFAVTTLVNLAPMKNAHVWYWGDLDAQGFEILAILRERVPHTRTLFMDRATWREFGHLAVAGIETRNMAGPYLTAEEVELYDELRSRNVRFEQERIPHAWASERIFSAFS